MYKDEIFKVFYGKETWKVYHKFKNILSSIESSNKLYKYFDDIKEMLLSDKSYIRVRGFKLICKLSKWDKENKINKILTIFLNELDDDKPSSVRMCLSSLSFLMIYKEELNEEIKNKLKKIDYLKYKDTMSPLIKKDIEDILKNN